VVVTGASSGIGRACALHLAALGFQVFAGVRRAEDGATLRAASSDRLTPVLLDVADETSIRAATETVTAAVGAAGLAGLVNNAGIGVAGPLEFLPLAEFRTQLEVNVTGQLAVTQALLPLLRQGRGRIVNMGYSPSEWCRNGRQPLPPGRERELTIMPPCAFQRSGKGSLERDTRWLLTGWH
jgi:NAD(P)-dependent dehydrogenase (short-subunit alcohol dehydrogenase family)